MLRHIWKPIAVLAAGVLLALPAAAQDGRDAQAELAELLASDDATSAQMAMGLLRVLEGAEFQPPDCVAGQEMFDDVPASNQFCPFIEELARRGITSGCGGGGNFCPGAPVSRAQMATFIVRALESIEPSKPLWAHVLEDGEIFYGKSDDIIDVTHPQTGLYCVQYLRSANVQQHAAQATSNNSSFQRVRADSWHGSLCNPLSDETFGVVPVYVEDIAGAPADGAFTILIPRVS